MKEKTRNEKSVKTINKFWDVLIVGAGPAGLFATLEIVSNTNLSVLLIESGHDIQDRHRELLQKNENKEEQTNYIKGVGGAGLYSDGKLCFSLDVGGQLKSNLNSERKNQLLRKIADYFDLLLEFDDMEIAKEEEVATIQATAARAGLNFKYYPVLSIGTERCSNIISQMKEKLVAKGATIISNCELQDINGSGDENFKSAVIKIENETHIVKAHQIVLAMGKVGATTESRICKKLGVNISSRPMYIGVRLETATKNLAPLFSISKDPKFNMTFPDDSKVKTHCASNNGQVLALSYDGLPIAGGHNFNSVKTGRSGFSVLWDGIQIKENAYETAKTIMQSIRAYTGGALLVQTLNDYSLNVASSKASLHDANLSNKIYKTGNIRDFLPNDYFHKFNVFIKRLSKLAPDIISSQTVLYAPAIEWWMNKIEIVNEYMETSCKGLYVCGDGSGWSQGIVHAAATGLLVAEGILENNSKVKKQYGLAEIIAI